jgi:CheY-like chemotaxis protein/predicted Ser/Thr protein kinase
MANLDASQVAQLAVRVGLLTPDQATESLAEAGTNEGGEGLVKHLERKGWLTPWQSQKLLKGERDGYFLGGYKLLYLISKGSFGRVYRAEDQQTGTVVAIKVLRASRSDAKSVELFEREAKLGQTLVHENIVQILAVSRDVSTGQHYMVMEFVEGGTLKDFLAVRKKLEPAEALKLIEDAAAGLAHAHAMGLSHRDIKPTNILISSQGVAKLVDFGLAGISATQPGAGGETKMQRTVDYAGLEKATGVKAGDVRSDIYFLGCVLYEMLTGRAPLGEARDARERMQRGRFDKVPPIAPQEVNGPPSVIRLVETMMSLDPAQRYQTPKQLLDAIRKVRAELENAALRLPAAQPGVRTVFVVEAHEKLREAIRDHLKGLGYKVLLSADPARALERFQQAPFSALVLDAGTTGEPGMEVFQTVMADAEMRALPTAGVLILSESQSKWAERLFPRRQQAVLVRPVTLKQLESKLLAMVPLPTTTV